MKLWRKVGGRGEEKEEQEEKKEQEEEKDASYANG
jgi:hypothetical protein